MKIISWNVNGLRAVQKKGFLNWFKKAKPDILCLQETKARQEQLPPELTEIKGYNTYFNSASSKKGYSGVAVFSKEKPKAVKTAMAMKRFDQEGRILELEYTGFTLVNLYLPFGGREKENLDYKLAVYQNLFKHLDKLKTKDIILTGDFNIAHKEIDLARPKENKNNIMFTPEERKQIDKLIEKGFVDTFRKFHEQGGHYTWWIYFANARERNIGWRIDYVFCSKPMTGKLKKAFILPEVMGSDHCPVGIEF